MYVIGYAGSQHRSLNFKVRHFFFSFGLEGARFGDFTTKIELPPTLRLMRISFTVSTACALVCSTIPGIAGVQFVRPIPYSSAENIIGSNFVEHASSE